MSMQRLRTAYAFDAHFARQGFRTETLRHLEVDAEITRDMVHVDDGYVREGYGQPMPAMWEALQTAARSEGLPLDPVYTVKTMAALLDPVRRGIVP